MNQREIRIAATPQTLELRSNADGTRSIVGAAVVYNSTSEDLGGFKERIAPGAFRNSLRTTEVQCLYSHQDQNLLGRQSSGTLTITDGPDALRFDCKLPNTTTGNDVAALCARGDLRGMSFGFTAIQDQWTPDADGTVIRTVQEAVLYELSVVGNPAYLSSSVSLRSCPANLRSKISKRYDYDDYINETGQDLDGIVTGDWKPDDQTGQDPNGMNVDGDADDTEDRCSCRCERCLNNRCERCIRSECADSVCYDNGCAMPGQDDNRNDDMRIRSMFAARQRLAG